MEIYDDEKNSNNLIVSNKFVEIFRNFNVFDQTEKIKELSRRELYLLLVVCLDKHDDLLPVVKYNFQPFRDEIMEIFDIQDDKETTNDTILDLIKESGDKYLETDNIIDIDGNKLPEPYTKEEVRDAKINIINKD
jgi:hypothetical protein